MFDKKSHYKRILSLVLATCVVGMMSFSAAGYTMESVGSAHIDGLSSAYLILPDLEMADNVSDYPASLGSTASIINSSDAKMCIGERLINSANASSEQAYYDKLRAATLRGEIIKDKENKALLAEQERLMEERRLELGLDEFTDSDYNNLLRIVQAEAGICDLEGKMVVANVILNRVKSSRFPNTISGVIFAPKQFSPVSNGRFYSCKVTDETREAVDRVLSGEDNSQGALFFMNRSASRSGAAGWFDKSLTFLFAHGGHEYYK